MPAYGRPSAQRLSRPRRVQGATEVVRIFRLCNNPRSRCSCQSSVCSFFFYICHCEGANARRAARKAIAKCHCEGRRLEQRFKGKRELVVNPVANRFHEIHVSRTSGSLHVPVVTHGFCF